MLLVYLLVDGYLSDLKGLPNMSVSFASFSSELASPPSPPVMLKLERKDKLHNKLSKLVIEFVLIFLTVT